MVNSPRRKPQKKTVKKPVIAKPIQEEPIDLIEQIEEKILDSEPTEQADNETMDVDLGSQEEPVEESVEENDDGEEAQEEVADLVQENETKDSPTKTRTETNIHRIHPGGPIPIPGGVSATYSRANAKGDHRNHNKPNKTTGDTKTPGKNKRKLDKPDQANNSQKFDPECKFCKSTLVAQVQSDIVITYQKDDGEYDYLYCNKMVLFHSIALRDVITNHRISVRNGSYKPKPRDFNTTETFDPHQNIVKLDAKMGVSMIQKVIQYLHTGKLVINRGNFEKIACIAVVLKLIKLRTELEKVAEQFGFKWVQFSRSFNKKQGKKDEKETEDTTTENEKEEKETHDSNLKVFGGKKLMNKLKRFKKVQVVDFITVPPKKKLQVKRKQEAGGSAGKKPRRDNNARHTIPPPAYRAPNQQQGPQFVFQQAPQPQGFHGLPPPQFSQQSMQAPQVNPVHTKPVWFR